MTHLHAYIAAINAAPSAQQIAKRELTDHSFEEAGIEVTAQTGVYTFANGVVVQREFELEQSEPDPSQSCQECWIGYKVLSLPDGLEVQPRSKAFANKCQELFWMRMTARDQAVSA